MLCITDLALVLIAIFIIMYFHWRRYCAMSPGYMCPNCQQSMARETYVEFQGRGDRELPPALDFKAQSLGFGVAVRGLLYPGCQHCPTSGAYSLRMQKNNVPQCANMTDVGYSEMFTNLFDEADSRGITHTMGGTLTRERMNAMKYGIQYR
jgi:hypothetical protein